MDEATKNLVNTLTPAFVASIEVYRLPSAKQILVVRKGGRNVGLTRSWDVTPGNPVTSVLNDAIPWLTKSLVDFFASWGRI